MNSPATVTPYRRNVVFLAIAQGLFMCTQSMGIATTPLAAHSLLGADKSLATLPIFLNHAGIMLTTIPASLLMGRIGRRAGFTIGAFLAIVFGLLAAYAVVIRSFELLCVSALLQGSAAAFAWYYRFAAADASFSRMLSCARAVVFTSFVASITSLGTRPYCYNLNPHGMTNAALSKYHTWCTYPGGIVHWETAAQSRLRERS